MKAQSTSTSIIRSSRLTIWRAIVIEICDDNATVRV
jgi:hypothetical protein